MKAFENELDDSDDDDEEDDDEEDDEDKDDVVFALFVIVDTAAAVVAATGVVEAVLVVVDGCWTDVAIIADVFDDDDTGCTVSFELVLETVKLENALLNRLFATGCCDDDTPADVAATITFGVSAETTLTDVVGDCKSVWYSFVFTNDWLSIRFGAETTVFVFEFTTLEA